MYINKKKKKKKKEENKIRKKKTTQSIPQTNMQINTEKFYK